MKKPPTETAVRRLVDEHRSIKITKHDLDGSWVYVIRDVSEAEKTLFGWVERQLGLCEIDE